MNDQRSKQHLERINALPIWTASVEARVLTGGITNSNYLVSDSGKRYVVRILEEQPLLGINRENEVLCMKAGYQCGVSSNLIYSEPGVMVTDYIEGTVLTSEEIRKRENIHRTARVLKAVHGIGSRLTGEILYFSPFQAVRTYARRARELGARMPAGIDRALGESDRLEQSVGPFKPTLCHNDVLAANWIFDGKKMWLVDWEYAGVGNLMFDLGNLSANSRFDADMDEELLRCYLGRVSDRTRRDLQIMKTASLLRESLWGLVQTVISGLDFDYHKYAADNLEAYHSAREELARLLRHQAFLGGR